NAITPRVLSGDFEAVLVDAHIAPTLFQAYQWWYSNGPRNFTQYKSAAVDAALDSVRRAPNDEAYRRGVAAFQKAIIEDPPAIFLAWSERARAVSTRFRVPADVGRDVYSTIRLWRPSNGDRTASRN